MGTRDWVGRGELRSVKRLFSDGLRHVYSLFLGAFQGRVNTLTVEHKNDAWQA